MVSNVLCVLDKGYTLYPLNCPSLLTPNRIAPSGYFPPFHPSRILTLLLSTSVTMYNPVPTFLTDPAWQSRIFPTVPMLSVTGRPRGYAGVRRISFGMTIRPRSSMRLTMPVAFIYCSSTLCVRNHIAIVCKQWGIMRMEDKEGKGRARVGICRAEYGAFFRN